MRPVTAVSARKILSLTPAELTMLTQAGELKLHRVDDREGYDPEDLRTWLCKPILPTKAVLARLVISRHNLTHLQHHHLLDEVPVAGVMFYTHESVQHAGQLVRDERQQYLLAVEASVQYGISLFQVTRLASGKRSILTGLPIVQKGILQVLYDQL